MPRSTGSKQLILDFFLSNLGVVLTSKDIQRASGGAVEWARRVRELRNEEGYQILSHKDRASLKPNQYVMETTDRLPAFARESTHGSDLKKASSSGCLGGNSMKVSKETLENIERMQAEGRVTDGKPAPVECVEFQVTLPIPPSTNALFLETGNPKCPRVKTPEYKAWLAVAVHKLRAAGARVRCPVRIQIFIVAGKGFSESRDLDNVAKPVCDSLVTAGIIPGDSVKHVKGVSIEYDEIKKRFSMAFVEAAECRVYVRSVQ